MVNPPPGFEHHPPRQPGDVTSSTRLNYAEYENFSDRRKSQHYESCEEDSGFDDCSGHNTSDRRKSPETKEGLSIRKQPMKLSNKEAAYEEAIRKGGTVNKKAAREAVIKEASLKTPLADTRGRDADLLSVGTSTMSAVEACGPIKSADTPVARLSQAGGSAALASDPLCRQLVKTCQHPWRAWQTPLRMCQQLQKTCQHPWRAWQTSLRMCQQPLMKWQVCQRMLK